MDTTPTYGWPYPEPADARGQGANAIRDLALAAEDTLRGYSDAHAVLRKSAVRGTTEQALPNGEWANAQWEAADDGTLGYDGVNISYSGPPRLFLVSFGGLVAVNGSMPSGSLRLILSGYSAVETFHTDNGQSLSAAIPIMLGEGTGFQVATVQAMATDGSGGLGGALRYAWLRLATMG